jgi:hypothetical protein
VRGLLEEAIRRTADASVIGRRVAAVLLDGAAEAAMATAMAAFNDSPNERDSLDELQRRLVEHLHAAGRLRRHEKLDGWPDVRRLRRVRNGAQHHQIAPDHQTLVAWAASVQRFIAHVIVAAYDVNVLAVTAADAIEDEQIRAEFGKAEASIAASDIAEGVKTLSHAFSAARKLWQQQHRRALGLASHHFDEFGIRRMIDSATEPMADMLEVAPFISDLGEYIWWRQLTSDVFNDLVRLSDDDGRRALSFVFTWIVRWEAFNAGYTRRERLPHLPEADPPPSSHEDGRPELDPRRTAIAAYEKRRDRSGAQNPTFALEVPYRAGSAKTPVQRWWHYIDNALHDVQRPTPWKSARRRPGGWIWVSVDPDAFDAMAILRELEERLQRVPGARAANEAVAAAARAARQELENHTKEQRADVLAVRLPDGSPVYEDAAIDFDKRVRARFTPELHHLVVREFFGHDSAPIPDLEPGHLDGIGVYVDPQDVEQLATVAARAVEPILAVKASTEAAEAEAASRAETMRRELEAVLRRQRDD